MGLFESSAADVGSPLLGQCFVITVATTSASVDLSAWLGEWITIENEGGPCWYAFGASGGTLDETAASNAAGSCGFIAENGVKPINFIKTFFDGKTYLYTKKAAATTATVKLRVHKS